MSIEWEKCKHGRVCAACELCEGASEAIDKIVEDLRERAERLYFDDAAAADALRSSANRYAKREHLRSCRCGGGCLPTPAGEGDA
jgi:hypothetical protein